MRTLLGSCVAITLWHTASRMGGMCHCLLPEMPSRGDNRDTLYVEGAVKLFRKHLLDIGAYPQDCVVKLFGGGNMFPQRGSAGFDVGLRNVETARLLLQEAGFALSGEHVGGNSYRIVILDIASGDTWLRAPVDVQQDGLAEIEPPGWPNPLNLSP